MPHRFQLVAGHVALDFANTLDNRYDPEHLVELLPTFDRLIAFAQQSAIITPSQSRSLLSRTGDVEGKRVLARAIAVREALHVLFLSVVAQKRPPQSAIGTLNRFLLDCSLPQSMEWSKSGFRWRVPELAANSTAPLTKIVEAAAALLTSADVEHIRECSAPSCRWFFIDRSKNHTRRWCDMRICGNRAKAQRFHLLQKVRQKHAQTEAM